MEAMIMYGENTSSDIMAKALKGGYMPVIQISIDNVFAFAVFVSGLNALVFSYFFMLIFRRIKEDEFMYSPKISEEHIPKLYKIAKEQGKPMTKVVNEMIDKALKADEFRYTRGGGK